MTVAALDGLDGAGDEYDEEGVGVGTEEGRREEDGETGGISSVLDIVVEMRDIVASLFDLRATR